MNHICSTYNHIYVDFEQLTTGWVLLTPQRQLQKMVKHTQTICWQQPTNFLSVFDHFVGLARKGLTDQKNLKRK